MDRIKSYNCGIDLFRITAMFLVVVVHIVGVGGVFQSCCDNIYAHSVCCLLEVVSMCAVNCYALISGYVYYTNRQNGINIRKYMRLWLEVVLYGLTITVIISILHIGDKMRIIYYIQAAMPVCFNQYWYFTAYTGVYFLGPWIRHLYDKTDLKEDCLLVVILIGLFSVYQTVTSFWGKDIFHAAGGYSFLWLLILYILGALIHKYECQLQRIKIGYLLIALAVFVWIFSCGNTASPADGKPSVRASGNRLCEFTDYFCAMKSHLWKSGN